MRYTVIHEQGGDWAVWDTWRNIAVATGLDHDEAEENAACRNETENSQKI